MRVARIWHRTLAEGPGLRTAIWVQGCSIGCLGCINPHLWSFEGGDEISVKELADRILHSDVEGITLLGGEPFDQALECAELARLVRTGGKGVITFTGHVYEDLIAAQRTEWITLLAATDLLVDGPYKRDLPEPNRAWVGSLNQRFLNLTDRYQHIDPADVRNRIEMRVTSSGVVELCGFASSKDLRDLATSFALKVTRSTRLL